MTHEQYSIQLTGELLPGKELAEVKQQIVKIFKISPVAVDTLLQRAPAMVKKGLDFDTATRYMNAFARVGAACRIMAGHGAHAVCEPPKTGCPATVSPATQPDTHEAAAATRCPKCGYTRQAGDIAPAYECPRCGVIYAKATAPQEPTPPAVTPDATLSGNTGNRYAAFFKKHVWLTTTLGVLLFFILAGVSIEAYMDASIQRETRNFHHRLAMDTNAAFDRSLHDLMKIIKTVDTRIDRYRLNSDIIAHHVLGALDATTAFIALMRETADEEPMLYDYDVERTATTLYGNMGLIFSRVQNKRAEAILGQRLSMMQLRGSEIEKQMRLAAYPRITHPRNVAEAEAHETAAQHQENQRASLRHNMTMRVLQRRCDNGESYACEALADMQQRNDPTARIRAQEYRMWQSWAQMARAQAGGIDGSQTIQTWDDEWVEITPDTVEDVIAELRPEAP